MADLILGSGGTDLTLPGLSPDDLYLFAVAEGDLIVLASGDTYSSNPPRPQDLNVEIIPSDLMMFIPGSTYEQDLLMQLIPSEAEFFPAIMRSPGSWRRDTAIQGSWTEEDPQ